MRRLAAVGAVAFFMWLPGTATAAERGDVGDPARSLHTVAAGVNLVALSLVGRRWSR